jgi:inhibitor of nuclear factor kappa-B kinase subunit alpha
MVWWEVSHQEVAPLHFYEKGVKTGARCIKDVLQGVVKPLNTTVFNGQKWAFQQDSAPAHKAKTTPEWLLSNVPAFIRAEDWPWGSPKLNPLDYKLWAVLEDMAC